MIFSCVKVGDATITASILQIVEFENYMINLIILLLSVILFNMLYNIYIIYKLNFLLIYNFIYSFYWIFIDFFLFNAITHLGSLNTLSDCSLFRKTTSSKCQYLRIFCQLLSISSTIYTSLTRVLDIVDITCIVPARPTPNRASLSIGSFWLSVFNARASKYLKRYFYCVIESRQF